MVLSCISKALDLCNVVSSVSLEYSRTSTEGTNWPSILSCRERLSSYFFLYLQLPIYPIVQQPKAIYLANLVSSDKAFFSCRLYIFGMYIIRSRWVWSCYPWVIREIQDGDQRD